MTKNQWLSFVVPVLYLCIGIHLAHADNFDKGMDEYNKGNYSSAYKIWHDLAKEGNPRAQFSVAYMYEFGIELTPNYKTAAKWYRKAAEQGYAKAQNFIGWMYEMGKGVKADRTEALKWLRLAAQQGSEGAMADYRLVMRRYKRAEAQKYKHSYRRRLPTRTKV